MENIKPYKSIFYVALVFIIISIGVFVYYDKFTNLYTAIATFTVGLFAIGLYIKQQEDQKRDAANIILMEIRYAEKLIDRFSGSGVVTDFQNKIIPTENWYKYNYLFIKDLDTDEIDELNNFYNQCHLIDKGLGQLSVYKQLEQKSEAIHSAIVNIAKESLGSVEVYKNNRDAFIGIINKEPYIFNPDAPIQTIIKAMGNIRFITTSTVGAKLKKIAKLK